ncbi:MULTISPECIES: GNAT family N-acetyltransferase [unclassified Exiguobacterium]|uniref:GNAT family N-acetyltransferase n=1 Tax=unclassified Exiguobacterium TaxID=2644629 RepID=UPI001BE82EF8|nr:MULTISPECIES: GNAT family N-acetyltransferase [unclassified Exiguobacterium]
MKILRYEQLSHGQRRLVHQLLQKNRLSPPSLSFQPPEKYQWALIKGDAVCATLGFNQFASSLQIINAAYTDLIAFRTLAHFVHDYALSLHPHQIDVQIIPPHDFGLVSTWNTLGYTLSSEQFRFIGLINDHAASLQFKPLTLRNRSLFLNLRNESIQSSHFLFSYDVSHIEYLIEQGALPYLVYDQQTIVGTIIIQKQKQTIRLLEITCIPELKNQGYGRRILETFQAKLKRTTVRTFETYCFSTHQEALRLYDPDTFCDIQLFSHWHTYSRESLRNRSTIS